MSHIAFVINSCSKYYETTVPILLASMDECKIDRKNIFIIVGGEADAEEQRDQHFFVKYNNVDNNALIWASETDVLGDYEWIFYLHDTCTVTETFLDKANSCLITYKDANAVKIHGPFSMCIGFYRLNVLRQLKDAMQHMKNFDTSPAAVLNVKNSCEDQVFYLIQNLVGQLCTIPNVYNVVENDVMKYGTDIHRIVEFYDMPGIYKYKGNHGHAPSHINL